MKEGGGGGGGGDLRVALGAACNLATSRTTADPSSMKLEATWPEGSAITNGLPPGQPHLSHSGLSYLGLGFCKCTTWRWLYYSRHFYLSEILCQRCWQCICLSHNLLEEPSRRKVYDETSIRVRGSNEFGMLHQVFQYSKLTVSCCWQIRDNRKLDQVLEAKISNYSLSRSFSKGMMPHAIYFKIAHILHDCHTWHLRSKRGKNTLLFWFKDWQREWASMHSLSIKYACDQSKQQTPFMMRSPDLVELERKAWFHLISVWTKGGSRLRTHRFRQIEVSRSQKKKGKSSGTIWAILMMQNSNSI